MKTEKNIFYTDEKLPQQVLDLYLPDCNTFPVLVYFHGGGMESGDKSADIFYKYLQKKGIAIVSANYRLYPFAAYPDFIKDAAAAVSWAYSNMSKYGTVTDFYIGGSSAGGYIAQMLCFDKTYLAKHKIDADSITGYITNAGQPTVHFRILAERGLDTRRVIIDEAAPIYHICEKRNYPPIKIIVSDHDMPNRYEQTLLLVSTLEQFGYKDKIEVQIVKDSNHCSYDSKLDNEGNSVYANMLYDFISKHSETKW